MSAKVDPNEETIQMGVRIPKSLAGALDAEAKRLEAQHPGLRFTRSEVARAVLTRVLLLQAPVVDPTPPAPAVANPTPPKAPAPARQPTLPTVAPAPLTLEQAVIAALKAVEKAGIGGELEMDLATVVRALEAQSYTREAINAELVHLGTEGVDVLVLIPDSGGGNELKEDRAIVPRRMVDGVPFLKAHWKKRPVDPPTEQDSDALRVRFREALRLKKTSINKSAEPAGCSTTPLRRWLNDGKELDALYRENLDKFLLTVGA
jgi:hypothetical protein